MFRYETDRMMWWWKLEALGSSPQACKCDNAWGRLLPYLFVWAHVCARTCPPQYSDSFLFFKHVDVSALWNCPVHPCRDAAKLQAQAASKGGSVSVTVDGKTVQLSLGTHFFTSATARALAQGAWGWCVPQLRRPQKPLMALATTLLTPLQLRPHRQIWSSGIWSKTIDRKCLCPLIPCVHVAG